MVVLLLILEIPEKGQDRWGRCHSMGGRQGRGRVTRPLPEARQKRSGLGLWQGYDYLIFTMKNGCNKEEGL